MHDGVKKPKFRHVLTSTPIFKALKRIFYAFPIWAFIFWTFIVCKSFAALPAIAADDDYLKALESEADDTGSLTTQQNNNPNPGKSNGVTNSAKEKFEKLLEFELPSTYKFYSKLNAEDQSKVIKRYNKEKKMSAASKLIFDLYFDRNK
jgi:hypothetical protein